MEFQFKWESFWRGAKVEGALLRALSKAGGDAARAMKAASSKAVRAKKRFKVARVNAAMPITFPRGKKDLSSLVWRMDVRGKPVPVSELPVRQTAKGVSVAINTGSRKVIKSAFLANLGGHQGVFFRVGHAGRLPIKEAFTTRISDVFKDAGMVPEIQARTQGVFLSAFARLLPLELEKAKK